MGKYRVPVMIVVGILIALSIFVLVGALLEDETDLEEQPVNNGAGQVATADVG